MKYLTLYNVQAYEVSFGGNYPYKKREEHRFEAQNDSEAKEQANTHRFKIVRELIGATVALDSLLVVDDVPLK